MAWEWLGNDLLIPPGTSESEVIGKPYKSVVRGGIGGDWRRPEEPKACNCVLGTRGSLNLAGWDK